MTALVQQKEAIEALENRQDEQDGRMTDLERQLDEWRRELVTAHQEMEAMKVEQNKGFFKRLFGKWSRYLKVGRVDTFISMIKIQNSFTTIQLWTGSLLFYVLIALKFGL